MTTTRTAIGTGLLIVETGLAAFGVLVHYGLTAEYGNVTDSALEGWAWGFSAGVGGLALLLVVVPGALALAVSSTRWMRLAAVAVPPLMVLAMLAVTPLALQEKLDVQFDAVPQCVFEEDMGPGPGTRAARESQAAFESIDHVGHFGGGGGSGVGGCDRGFVLTDDVDVLQHYRQALEGSGWKLAEDDEDRLRAERDGMAFEVAVCDEDSGVVWAGSLEDDGGAGCDPAEQVG